MNRPLLSSEAARHGRLDVPPLPDELTHALRALDDALDGEVRCDDVSRLLYATDASLYEIVPVGVAMPRSEADFARILAFARQHRIPVTARTAGTSLAGQAVGPGLVVDTGRYLTSIVACDPEARRVRVQPGVIRDDLNRVLAPHGLLFGPDTSTSNRCMIGGMIGNNSCGSFSIHYGTTRDHVESIRAVFADGTIEEIGRVDRATWAAWARRDDALGAGLHTLERLVRDHAQAIHARWPRKEVVRRNTGYALDDLADSWLGTNPDRDPDLARFLCGSEGTLALTAEATLRLEPVPKAKMLVCGHFASLDESMHATVLAVQHRPAAVELMDKRILDLAALNPEQARNRWFLEGDPAALLVVEFFDDTPERARERAIALVDAWRDAGMGYAAPLIEPSRAGSVWALRKAGLGVLFGTPGDVKPVTLVEDTAVAVDDLPAFVEAFARIMADWRADCVYYAHASVGELHLRPELNLKEPADIERANGIARDVADLVHRFRGSLSGEHGDGRLRSPWIERVLGAEAIGWLEQVKDAFDPAGLLNPGNIVRPEPMESHWRYHPTYEQRDVATLFSYASSGGFQRAIERCNGSGECRRLPSSGGTMCPSYMVTLEEKESTRGRANVFRRLVQSGPDALFTSEELRDALDLCISCKGCRSECPASVDMAKLKAEFQQGWMDRHGVPLASRLFARVTDLHRAAQIVPGGAAIANAVQGFGPARALMQRWLGIDARRPLPAVAPSSAHDRVDRGRRALPAAEPVHGDVILYLDEFIDRYEPEVAQAAIEVLSAGGWRVRTPRLGLSGRGFLSKGMVRHATAALERLVDALDDPDAGDNAPRIVGLEPSAVLTLVDEAPDLLAGGPRADAARRVASRVRLFEQFVVEEHDAGRFSATFTDAPAELLVHGHCHQKSLVGMAPLMKALALPANFTVRAIPSGCCGMAGSFGYEAKHRDVSMAIGELVLFPAVRDASATTVLVAPGTSCRHQIEDGTGRHALHPAVVLRDALARGT